MRPKLLLAVMVSFAALAAARCSPSNDTCDACIDVTPAPLTVLLTPAELYARVTDAMTLAVAIERGPGGDGDATITVSGAPGVSADPLVIAAAQTTGTLVVHVDGKTFPQGDATVSVNAQTAGAQATASLLLHVAGASGTLDTSFGKSGVLDLTSPPAQDDGVALVSLQDTIVLGGTRTTQDDAGTTSAMMLIRASKDGALDGTFGSGGFAFVPATWGPTELGAIAMLPDGRIYAVGDARPSNKASFAAFRFLATGAIDPTYGVVTSISSADDLARAGGVEPGGRLAIAGIADGGIVALARYTQSPAVSDAGLDADEAGDASVEAEAEAAPTQTSVLDPTFGGSGVILTSLPLPAGASALVVQTDGALVVTGTQTDGITGGVFAARYTTAGTPDVAFGTAGFASFPFTTAPSGKTTAALLLRPDGSFVIASHDASAFFVAALKTDGSTDTSFANGGTVVLTMPNADVSAKAIARDAASGKLFVGGSSAANTCVVVRLTPNGAIDASFAAAGWLELSRGDHCEVVGVAVEDNTGKQRLLVAMTVQAGLSRGIVIERFWP